MCAFPGTLIQESDNPGEREGWHTEKWGTLGWVETGLKLLGIAVGLVALVRAFPLSTLVYQATLTWPL